MSENFISLKLCLESPSIRRDSIIFITPVAYSKWLALNNALILVIFLDREGRCTLSFFKMFFVFVFREVEAVIRQAVTTPFSREGG